MSRYDCVTVAYVGVDQKQTREGGVIKKGLYKDDATWWWRGGREYYHAVLNVVYSQEREREAASGCF